MEKGKCSLVAIDDEEGTNVEVPCALVIRYCEVPANDRTGACKATGLNGALFSN